MNNTISEMKNTLEGINNRITEAEEQISELEDKMVEISAEEKNKEKRMKRIENNLRYLWDNNKWTNIQIIGVPEEEGKKREEEERDWENIWNRMEKIQEMLNNHLEELKTKQTMMNNTIN